jgi:hypothetical protein
MWQPLSSDALKNMIGRQEYLFDEAESNFWNFIKTEPTKWTEKTMGNEGGGFWVVAIFGFAVHLS